jgi:ApeA N-terminal domain 1
VIDTSRTRAETKIEMQENCIEITTGESFAGTITLDRDNLGLNLFGYNKECHIPLEVPLFVRTATNKFISIYDPLISPSGQWGNGEFYVSSCTVDFNSAISGYDTWQPSDRIKTLRFSVPGTEGVMLNRHRLNSIQDKKLPDIEDLEIFTKRVGDLTLRAAYRVRTSLGGFERHSITPQFSIEFHNPVIFGEHNKAVQQFVGFLSFITFKKLAPEDIKISRYYTSELTAVINHDRNTVLEHEVHQMCALSNEEDQPLHSLHVSLVSTRYADEIKYFVDCLEHWFSSNKLWQEAQKSSFASMGWSNIFSSKKILDANKWLDDTPSADSLNIIPDEKMEKILSAAFSAAKELGYGDKLKERINGSLKKLSLESHAERFQRLLNVVNSKFGGGVFPQEMVDDLINAIRFRNKFAHKHFEFSDDLPFDSFVRSIAATEAICYLLLLAEFPSCDLVDKEIKTLGPVYRYRLHSLS